MKKKQYEMEVRCRACSRLVVRGNFRLEGELELFCPRCKTTFILRASRPNLAPQDGLFGDRYARNQNSPDL